ncbi:hypothetical protein SEVIR_3G253700v4 [Setaria viridis]|uniref:Uncharacterized protein n=1 Tax=Setaria viridis TaxID=4556 RepID=A0A4U6VF75_SETVI|nr:uncharacterized protein LOC101780790 [Setaria italica]XP_034586606.1 uncharacterized protein LOC117849127 [Setaria viridis]TKW27392.1 hypothetical protein SEVIR_3G253700v2 [Setaria viridis]
MGTAEVLRPHDCLARARRPLRPGPAGRRAVAARHHQGQRHGARGDIARGPATAAAAATAPRQVRTKVAAAAADAYAGPAFGAMSPSPRALPLPRFTPRTAADAAPGVDDAATRELRRLLGLH